MFSQHAPATGKEKNKRNLSSVEPSAKDQNAGIVTALTIPYITDADFRIVKLLLVTHSLEEIPVGLALKLIFSFSAIVIWSGKF